MASRSLKNAVFAAFERQILNTPHVGWVRWGPGGQFQLLKSPFRDTIFYDHYYRLPPDLRPKENSLVELEVEGPSRKLLGQINNTTYFKYKEYYDVVAIKDLDINKVVLLQKPYLERDEFLDRITCNWKNASEDHLDVSLALQLLSCPASIYGTGGIGSKSAAPINHTKKPLVDLKKTINRLLPTEFLRGSKLYQYNFIEDSKTLSEVEAKRIKGDVSEVSYNHLWRFPPKSVNTPINIPTLIYNSVYNPKNLEMDIDVLEYILTALAIRPHIEKYMESKIQDDAIKNYDRLYSDEALSKLNLDPFSPIKIGTCLAGQA